ncbi:hypothetical protein, partial [Xanthomonas translucens]|uniref:hypothetical protein n=1 Tax=Xanthomonas campestris pv. translucens TaxID=343 RepID=UPI001BAEACE1
MLAASQQFCVAPGDAIGNMAVSMRCWQRSREPRPRRPARGRGGADTALRKRALSRLRAADRAQAEAAYRLDQAVA